MSVTIRETTETSVRVELRPGTGGGAGKIETGVSFLDHMLTILARYSGLDFDVSARGDLRHHVIEAAFKALGFALRDALVDTGATMSTKGRVSVRVE